MPLKISISQKQKLSLTTHMQQSLQILQMDSISLKEKIELELQRNPVLEESYTGRHPSFNPAIYAAPCTSSLCEHLFDQLEESRIPSDLLPLVKYLILNMDDNGRLEDSPQNISKTYHIEPDKVHAAVKIIQSLEPAGIGAIDYRECLLLQAQRMNLPQTVYQILESDTYLSYLSHNQVSRLADALGISAEKASEAVRMIRSLNPKPGAGFGDSDTIYIVPDARVDIEDSGFSITIGDPSIPEIKINGTYSHMLKETSDPEVIRYLNECLKQAQSLISGITQRNKTLFLCVSEIVRRQPEYFQTGKACVKPMTLSDIADAVNLNVSTVSRAVKNKYIECCHGVIPLHSIFSSGLSQGNSDEKISSQKMQQLIRKLIDSEDTLHPLSDPDIANQLSSCGYSIARRTVAKYRAQMQIPSAAQRKRHDSPHLPSK